MIRHTQRRVEPPDTVLLVENANRQGFAVTNVSGTTLYVRFSAEPASANHFTFALGPGDVLDLLYGHDVYAGDITCLWSAATGGYAMVDEREALP